MQKVIATLLLFFIVKISIAQDDVTKSTWINSPVKVDGIADEWHQPLRFYDTDTKLFFSFVNDSSTLYLCFQAPEESDQMKIIRAGMKISLSIKGKDKHKVSIAFPLVEKKEEPMQPTGETNRSQKFSRANMKNSFLVQNTMMEVKGFTTKDGIISINDSSGINVAINWDSSGKLCYEIAIPFKEFLGTDYIGDMAKDIYLDAQVNAIERQGYAGGNGGAGGFHGGGGGGHMGGGGGGGRMGGGGRQRNNDDDSAGQTSSERSSLSVKGQLKQKFVLAQIQN